MFGFTSFASAPFADTSISRLLFPNVGVYTVTGRPINIVASGAVAGIDFIVEIRSFTERRRF
jgi:hypothetical protein